MRRPAIRLIQRLGRRLFRPPPELFPEKKVFKKEERLIATPRAIVYFGERQTNGAQYRFYLQTAGKVVLFGGDLGYTMPRSGSIIGVATAVTIEWPYGSQAGKIETEVRKNNSVVFTSASDTIDAAGLVQWNDTQAEGTDTFSAGDTLDCSINPNTSPIFNVTTASVAVILEFDS